MDAAGQLHDGRSAGRVPALGEPAPGEPAGGPADSAVDEGPAPADGRLIGGRYRLAAAVGRGNMGTVWRARDELLGRDVAVKEVRLPLGLSESGKDELRQRMLREARSAARLSHPAVVTVHDVVEDLGRPWIVMELIDGRSLDRVIAEDGRLPHKAVAEIGRQVLAALAAAHGAGVLHRDVKPSNVLLTRDGRAVLTDFGLAAIDGDPSLTQTGIVMGTPAFSAPERARGAVAAPAADLWSLGATLYAAVEGHGPYDGRGGPVETLAAIVTDDPPPPAHAGPLGETITAFLRRDPATRPSAAQALRMLSEAADAPAEIPGRRNPRGPRPPGRRRRAAAGAAAALACLAVGLSVSIYLVQRTTHQHTAGGTRASPSLRQDSTVRPGSAAEKRVRRAAPSAAGDHMTAPASGPARAHVPSHATGPHSPSPGSPPPPSSPLPAPVSWWKLDDGSGTTAADAMNIHPAAGTDIGWCATGDCATFNGSSSYFMTAAQVLDTGPGASFTVAASVYMTSLPANGAFATAASQGGKYDSSFFLQYSGPDKRWAFARVATDSDSSTDTPYRALSDSAPTLDRWTYLAGVFNGATGTMTLYVNGVAQGTVTDPTPFASAASGHFVMGRALYQGQNTDFFPGDLRNVEAFQEALSSTQVRQLFSERAG